MSTQVIENPCWVPDDGVDRYADVCHDMEVECGCGATLYAGDDYSAEDDHCEVCGAKVHFERENPPWGAMVANFEVDADAEMLQTYAQVGRPS